MGYKLETKLVIDGTIEGDLYPWNGNHQYSEET